jgi:hypothetical protein
MHTRERERERESRREDEKREKVTEALEIGTNVRGHQNLRNQVLIQHLKNIKINAKSISFK